MGSSALKIWVPTYNHQPRDIDVVSDVPLSDKFEYHAHTLLDNYLLEKYVSDKIITIDNHKLHVLSLKGLQLVKRSHLWRDLSFGKHITMYHKHLGIKSFNEDDVKFLKHRTELTHKAFDKWKSPSLKKTVEEFFDDYVTKKYDHDYLHELFAYYDKPLYTRLQNQDGSVWCDEDKWKYLSLPDKIKCVAEETQVIAAERFLIRKDWKYSSKIAYFHALEKVCTTLTSGWFRDFAIDHYPNVVDLYDPQRFTNAKSLLTEK